MNSTYSLELLDKPDWNFYRSVEEEDQRSVGNHRHVKCNVVL